MRRPGIRHADGTSIAGIPRALLPETARIQSPTFDEWLVSEDAAALTDRPGSAGLPVLRPALRWVLRAAVQSAGLGRVAGEVEQGLVDLVGVGPDDRVRPARDDGAAGVVQQRGEPAAGGLVGQDAILVAMDDQDGNLDSCEISPEVFPAGCDAAGGGVGRGGEGDVEAVLPRLVADPAAAQEIDVVGVVQEVFCPTVTKGIAILMVWCSQ